jgi:hypothetical protein
MVLQKKQVDKAFHGNAAMAGCCCCCCCCCCRFYAFCDRSFIFKGVYVTECIESAAAAAAAAAGSLIY